MLAAILKVVQFRLQVPGMLSDIQKGYIEFNVLLVEGRISLSNY